MSIFAILGIISTIVGLIGFLIAAIKPLRRISHKIWLHLFKIKHISQKQVLSEKETAKINSHIFLPQRGNSEFHDYKLIEARGEEILNLPINKSISRKDNINFLSAKKPADRIATIWKKKSKLVYSTNLSYDVYAKRNGDPFIKSLCWVYMYRYKRKYLLIHVINNLDLVNLYSWRMKDDDFNSKHIPIKIDDFSVDSDQAYRIAERNGAFVDKGGIVDECQ